MSGTGAVSADTKGAQQVNIFGTSFGPPAMNAVTNVTYGKTGVEYVATACIVLLDSPVIQSQMACVTAPGTGANLLWVVTIGGQPSPLYGYTSYAPPSIASYDGPGAQQGNTQGGLLIYINGNNFGPVLRPTDNITYTAHVESGTNSSLPFVPVSPATNGTITFVPTNCTLSIPHEQIRTCAVGLLRASLVFAVWLSGQRFCTCFALLS